MIYLNGKEHTAYATLTELLDKNDYKRTRIAVEINGRIIKRSDYDQIEIHDGDRIEVVSFVGGG